MNRALFFITVLLVSVFTTACVNNLAVQDLNSKAKAYLDSGEAQKAICRLESSVDLDGGIFETRYNLATAYIRVEEFEKAVEQLKVAHNLKPDFVDYYYSMALAIEGEAFKKIDDAESPILGKDGEAQSSSKRELSNEDKIFVVKKLNEAVETYNEYLSKKPDAANKDTLNSHIEMLNNEIKKYNSEVLPEENAVI